MNLAQCITPDWAQKLPASGPTAHPMSLPWLRVITRENGIDKVRTAGVVDLSMAPLPEIERRPKPAVAAPKPSPTLATRAPRGRRGRTSDNPWPRGKTGHSYCVLKLVAGSRQPPVLLHDVAARMRDISSQHCYMVLKNLVTAGFLVRSGLPKHYRYAITDAGRKALDA